MFKKKNEDVYDSVLKSLKEDEREKICKLIFDNGFAKGFTEGLNKGFTNGYTEGFSKGFTEGRKKDES